MLLERLRALQAERGLSDRQVADAMGIPRSTWQRTRAGDLPMTERVARAARNLFPQAEREITMFLLYGEDAPQARCGEAETASRGGGGRKRQARSTTALIGGQDS